MAMSGEQQKAASDRIMAKEALTEEEQRTYKYLTMKVEDYPKPDRDHRKCGNCGAEFQTIPGTKETEEVTAMQQWVDHLRVHQPTLAQWGEAHKRIQLGFEKQKEQQKSGPDPRI